MVYGRSYVEFLRAGRNLSFRPVSENIHSVVLHISYVVYIQSVAHWLIDLYETKYDRRGNSKGYLLNRIRSFT